MSRRGDSDLEHSGFFALRTPLLPFDEFAHWGEGLAGEDDRALLRERLREAVARPELREAILLSSPQMADLIDAWAKAPESTEGKRCERALVRYFSRATGRSTPHGLFAGVSWGPIGEETRLELDGRERYSRQAHASLEPLLVAELEPLRPNPALYRVGETVRFITGGSRLRPEPYTLKAIRSSPAVEAVLDAASSAATRAELAEAGGPTLVERMVELGALVPSRAVTLTREQRDASLGENVELVKPARNAVLGAAVLEEIARAIELAHRLGRPNPPDPELERFRERFEERYGWSEVPLLEALDPEVGVGFGPGPRQAPLIEEVFSTRVEEANAWGAREQWLLERVSAFEGEELVLRAQDVEALAEKTTARRPLPSELACLAVIAARSEAELASGRFRVLVKEYGGPGRIGLLSRFCLDDPRLRDAVRAHLRAEEALDQEAVFAEIVHLPSERHADLLERPLLREYEIDCLGPSGVPLERQLPLSDLRLSIGGGGHLTLRSERLGRRVVPRLTAAHNFQLFGAKPYRFLCKLQAQGISTGADFWGPLAELPRLPRVRVGRVVLQRARWRLAEKDLGGDPDFLAIRRWRRAVGAPRLVTLSEREMELPVDLDNVLSVEALANAVRSNGEALLLEWFPPPDELIVRGPEGAFAHELLVPFVRPRSPARPEPRRLEERPRIFPPGSGWFYAKWFANASAIDRVLVDAVGPLVGRLRDAEAIDRWFFMRFDEPEFQLRLRLHVVGDRARVEREAAAAADELLEPGLLSKVEIGTYVQETGRYGGPEAFELAEQFFEADSDAVLELLPAARRDAEMRWRLGLYGVHATLVELSLGLEARRDLAHAARGALAQRLELGSEETGRIGERFRQEQEALSELLETGPPESTVVAYEARGRCVKPLGEHLHELEREGRLTRTLPEIASSLAHMHLNRLLPALHQEHELVIYDFLARLYEEAAHRAAR